MTWRPWRVRLPRAVRRKIVVTAAGCWEWRGGVNGSWITKGWGGGYGYVDYEGRKVRVHRLVYQLLVGDPGDLLKHSCDNRRCCCPNHLEPGTASENQTERWERVA